MLFHGRERQDSEHSRGQNFVSFRIRTRNSDFVGILERKWSLVTTGLSLCKKVQVCFAQLKRLTTSVCLLSLDERE